MKGRIALIVITAAYIAFAIYSFVACNEAGQRAVAGLIDFAKQMAILLPFAFILIGLFEVWIRKETVERYLGTKTGFTSYFLAIALAGITIGGLYVAFPLSYSLYKKGAKLAVVFTYLSSAGICRIPMAIFEATFLGLKFTIIRFTVSIPLVVLTSWLIGSFMQKRGYALQSPSLKKGND